MVFFSFSCFRSAGNGLTASRSLARDEYRWHWAASDALRRQPSQSWPFKLTLLSSCSRSWTLIPGHYQISLGMKACTNERMSHQCISGIWNHVDAGESFVVSSIAKVVNVCIAAKVGCKLPGSCTTILHAPHRHGTDLVGHQQAHRFQIRTRL